MTCPSCKYEFTENFGFKGKKDVIGDKGDFFFFKKRMRREGYKPYHKVEKVDVYACPSCGTLFIHHEDHNPFIAEEKTDGAEEKL